MRVEVVAVGTELLLGQIADTNSQWLGEELAAAGVSSHFHQAVGDNHDRTVLALRTALARCDAVIVCGGLGPTQDDITREAIAAVMNVELVRDEAMVKVIAKFFENRGRIMPQSNARQANVPKGAGIIVQKLGTAPGLICPVGNKVIYAVPGVPFEMMDMFERGILPDLYSRDDTLTKETIKSRVLRTWGTSESALAEMLGPRIDELSKTGGATLAFLASGIEGIKVRITVKSEHPTVLLDAEEEILRGILGDIIFGVDQESMESTVALLLIKHNLTISVAESLTGGLLASRLVAIPGASNWFKGGVVAYASSVKHELLSVPKGPVVSQEAALAMALGARDALGSDIALGITGVAGPGTQEGVAPGTVHVGLALKGNSPSMSRSVTFQVPGDRTRVRQYASISALDIVRRALM